MTVFDRVKILCDRRKISINDLEKSLGYSRNTLYRLKTQNPGADKLEEIADYFNVSTDYLLGRTDNHEIHNIAAHHDGDDWSDEELKTIEEFMKFVKSQRKNKEWCYLSYEKLLKEADLLNIKTFERKMPYTTKGLYADNVIWINRTLPTIDKTCVLAEEIGHHHTTVGDILDQSDSQNVKQEKQARNWAYKRLVPLDRIIEAHHAGIQNKHELAEYLNVTEAFLLDALIRYKEEYGVSKTIKQYTISFEPLAVLEMFPE